MSLSQKQSKKDTKAGKNDDTKTNQKQLTLDASLDSNESGTEQLMLMELRRFRQESGDAQRQIQESQTRIEMSVTEIKHQIDALDERLSAVETRVSNTEDRSLRQERALAYLLSKEAKLAARQDDMENRLRRNNIRLYGIPEDAEGKEMIPFIINFFKSSLKLRDDMNIGLERAHRATTPKPKPAAPPRSIIVRFLDFHVKQKVLQQAWAQRNVEFEGKKIYFDQDSPDVQRKRKQVREVIKKLRERNIKAQAPYPAQVTVFLDTGIKTFPSLSEAQPILKELGVKAVVDERDVLERELLNDRWRIQGNKGCEGQMLSPKEIRMIMNSVDQC